MSETSLEALREVYRIAKEAIDDWVERLQARGSVTREVVEPPPMEIGEDPIDQVLDRLLDLRPTIRRHMHGGYVWSACLRCDLVDVKVDEEGCCVVCGEDATFVGLESESPRTPSDSAVPEPAKLDNARQSSTTEGPKVVGYVSDQMQTGELGGSGILSDERTPHYRHPVILQSEHEEVVRGKMDILHRVAEKSQERQAEITRLKAENERLTEERDKYGQEMERLQRLTTPSLAEAVYGDEVDPPVAHVRRVEGKWVMRLSEHGERVTKEYDVLYRSVAVRRLEKRIREVEAERDAYADPKNWEGRVQTDRNGGVVDFTCQFTGPTPSDSTEAEPESVEGRVTGVSWSGPSVDAVVTVNLPPTQASRRPHMGDSVRISRLPETGGNDG